MSDNLGGSGAVLQATITITRKETGLTEEYRLTGYVPPVKPSENEGPKA